jgi:Rod binding domain-containing protein
LSGPISSAALAINALNGSERPGALQRLAAGSHDAASARAAGQEFEAMFIAQMLKPVFEGLTQGEMFGGGPGEKIYRGLLVQEYGKAVAARGGLGIGAQVTREILALQETDLSSGGGS